MKAQVFARTPVFKATNVHPANDGYDMFRTYAESVGRGAEWVAWSADEDCPQAELNSMDLEVNAEIVPWCSLASVNTSEPGCGDTGSMDDPTALLAGTYDGLKICSGEQDHWIYTGSDDVEITVIPTPSDALLRVTVFDEQGDELARSPSAGRQPMGSPDAQLEPIWIPLYDNQSVTIRVESRGPTDGTDYSLSIVEQ